ncbi:LacI family DNA-binding transcriptional regulator [Paractinoplanes globisporus]|uniref:LacI family DNA-binding transcriptional regulator n=1 Tax=Paractinoplanes globisporus TaxID=113565 RepID=A0ABW6W875_9ACTN|nr:substrate-binding domain-containing protein [Actinoplanes globisporus]
MTDERLFQVQRHERLLTELHQRGAVRVRELARDLGVSELTIRRDITALAARNLVTRVHGGATLPLRSRPAGRPRAATVTGFAIGMVVPSLDFSWPPVVAGARAAAAALGVTIQLRGSSHDPDEDRRQIGRLVEAGEVRGLLLAPSLDDDDIVDWIGRLPVPCVLVERQPRRWTAAARKVEWVRSDHALGLEIAVHHLREHGHRRIGLLLSPASPTSVYLRHPDLPPPILLDDNPSYDDVLSRCRRQGVTALIVHSDPQAIAIAQACADRGLRIPEDIALISYDDEVAHLAEPPLTAVRPPANHVGRLAVELIVSRLLGGSLRPARGVLVAPELVVRQSSPFHVRV